MPDFMTGALFHAILAWPTVKETDSYQRISEELMAGVIRLANAEDPVEVQWIKDEWPQFNWPSIEARAQKPKSALGYLNKRLTQRMAAAKVAIGKSHEQLFDEPVTLPKGVTSTSINQLCQLIKTDVSIDNAENIEKRVWRTSLPIIHLAMAAQLMLAGKFNDRTEFGADLQDIEFYRDAVHLAGAFELVVANHPEFAVKGDQLTQIRWFE
tara:strand:+ start:270 stop:902 length:633 start_codon:yes stop_codon:yes gene_type:complete